MVKKFLKLIHQEIAGVHQAAFFLGFFTFLSSLLALFRDRLLAHSFGASQSLDIYYAAFRVPDFIYASIASLVSISILIPFFTGIFETKKAEAAKLMDTIFTVFLSLMIVVSAIAWFLMPYIVNFILPGISDPQSKIELVNLSRILLLQPICLGISNLLGVVTQISKRFIIYAISPIFYNVAIIFGIIVLYPHFGLRGLVTGVIIGGLMHFAIQVPYVQSRGLLPKFTFNIDFSIVKTIFLHSIPRTITLSATQIELIFLTSYASFLTVGSISIFNFATNLQSVPFSIVAVSYALAAFPTLSGYFAKGETAKFIDHVSLAARHIIFWSVPITVLFIVLRAQIVRTILGSGSFNWDNTRLTAACVALFVVSLVAQGLELLFVRAYYAAGRTKKPLFVNIFSSIVTVTLPFFLLTLFNTVPVFRFFIEALFKVQDIPGSAVLMLPLGFTLGTIVNASIFWWMFNRDFGSFSARVWPTFFTSLQAAILGGFASYLALNLLDNYLNLDTLPGIFLQGLGAGVFGLLITVCTFVVLRNEEIIEVWNSFHQKLGFNNQVVVSDPEHIEV